MHDEEVVDYIGIYFEGEDEYKIFNFIDLWRFFEEIFEKESISLDESEFNDLKEKIITNIHDSIKIYYKKDLPIEKDIWKIKEQAVLYDDTIDIDKIDDNEKDLYILNYEFGDTEPVFIDDIQILNDVIIHIFSYESTNNEQKYEYGYFLLKLPSIKWFISGKEFDISNEILWDTIQKLGFLGLIYEYLFKMNLTDSIKEKFNIKKSKINPVINNFKSRIRGDYIDNYYKFETRFLQKNYIKLNDFTKGILERCYTIRNDIVHQGYKNDFLKNKYKIREIIPLFEVFLFNIESFFNTLNDTKIKLNKIKP